MVCLAEEKEPLIHAAFGPPISANHRFPSSLEKLLKADRTTRTFL